MPLHDEHPRVPYYRRRSPTWATAYGPIYVRFARWCAHHHRRALPASPDTLGAYLIDLHQAGMSPATLELVAAAVRVAHDACGFPPPDMSRLRPRLRRAGVPAPPQRSLHVDWLTRPPGSSSDRR